MVPSLSGVGSVMVSAVVGVGAAAAAFFLLLCILSVFEGFGLLLEFASVAFVFGVFAEEVACCYELEATEDDHFVLWVCRFACSRLLRGCDDCEIMLVASSETIDRQQSRRINTVQLKTLDDEDA